MAKFIFVPATAYQDDPVIRLRDGAEGVVNLVLIHKKGDTIYYNEAKHPGKYDLFEISKESIYAKTFASKFPLNDRLVGMYEHHLIELSNVTRIPLEELKEIKDIERMAKVPKPL